MKVCTTVITVVVLAAVAAPAHAESKQVFGIHFFDWGANVDVMSHRTGWVLEAGLGRDSPNVGGRHKPAAAQGFTIIQRLDWDWEQTVPLNEADQNIFATQCASYASKIRRYCRHYSIGNEVEFFDVTPSIYASAFAKVRAAIKNVQPEAMVHIGHMNNANNQKKAMELLGVDGYDGVSMHTGSSVPTHMLDILDSLNARPEVGAYITEWGWVAGTNPNAMNVMRGFADAIGASNASRARQVYAACWFVYPSGIGWNTFALELSPLDNAAFEAATLRNSAISTLSANPVLRSDIIADIPDHGTAITISWKTNVPASRQLWWTPAGTSGAGFEAITDQFDGPQTSHQLSMTALVPSRAYEVICSSTADGFADASARRFNVKAGPWTSEVVSGGGGVVGIRWDTDWPADSKVEFAPIGTPPAEAQVRTNGSLVTQHALILSGLTSGLYWYRVSSAEANPDFEAPLTMRSPIRTFQVMGQPGDFDADGDVDQADFGQFQACLTGPGVFQPIIECTPALLDEDEDVDQDDFGIFQACYSGPGVPASDTCNQ